MGSEMCIRDSGLSLVDAGLYLGLIGVFGGILGTLLSAILVDRLAQQDARWQLRLPMIGVLISIPTQALFLLWPASTKDKPCTRIMKLGDQTPNP